MPVLYGREEFQQFVDFVAATLLEDARFAEIVARALRELAANTDVGYVGCCCPCALRRDGAADRQEIAERVARRAGNVRVDGW